MGTHPGTASVFLALRLVAVLLQEGEQLRRGSVVGEPGLGASIRASVSGSLKWFRGKRKENIIKSTGYPNVRIFDRYSHVFLKFATFPANSMEAAFGRLHNMGTPFHNGFH